MTLIVVLFIYDLPLLQKCRLSVVYKLARKAQIHLMLNCQAQAPNTKAQTQKPKTKGPWAYTKISWAHGVVHHVQ